MEWSDRIGRRLKLRDLHILLAVVQTGSMSKAARQLSVSNPVVTKAVADLERTLGVRLLERNPRGVELTEYGRTMLVHSNAAFNELRQGVKSIERLIDPSAGEVRVGTSPRLAASFVTAVIDRLSRRYPRIVTHVVAGTSEMQQRNLRERNVDLLVFRKTSYFADEQVVDFDFLYESPYVVAVGKKNPWVRRRRIELAELANELWVLPAPHDLFGPFIVDAFRASGLEFPRAAVVGSALEMCANLLRTNRYLTILPEFWLQLPDRHPFIRKLAVKLPITGEPIGIISLKNRTPNPVAQRFIDCAREVARQKVRRD